MIDTYKKGKDISVMVWAAFSGALRRSSLYVMDRNPESKKGGTPLDLTLRYSRKIY
jgi:hypothetical protein